MTFQYCVSWAEKYRRRPVRWTPKFGQVTKSGVPVTSKWISSCVLPVVKISTGSELYIRGF